MTSSRIQAKSVGHVSDDEDLQCAIASSDTVSITDDKSFHMIS